MNPLSKFPKTILMVILGVSLLSLTSACGRREAKSKKDVVAYVNGEPIFARELKKSLELKARQEPGFKLCPEAERDQLEVLIEKKLIIQEAVEKGLAREDKFVDTIQTFWEQTLIRDFIDSKTEEFKNQLTASDDEVRKYYSHLGKRVTFRVLKSRNPDDINRAYEQMTKKGGPLDPKACEVIGPVGYDDITSSVLLKAFDLPLGGVIKGKDMSDYYLVTVIDKEPVTLKPLESLRPQIIERVVAMKERQLFEDWFKEQRNKAKIDIIKK